MTNQDFSTTDTHDNFATDINYIFASSAAEISKASLDRTKATTIFVTPSNADE